MGSVAAVIETAVATDQCSVRECAGSGDRCTNRGSLLAGGTGNPQVTQGSRKATCARSPNRDALRVEQGAVCQDLVALHMKQRRERPTGRLMSRADRSDPGQFVSLRGEPASTSATIDVEFLGSAAGGNLGRRTRGASTLSLRKSRICDNPWLRSRAKWCGTTTDFASSCKLGRPADSGPFASRLPQRTGTRLFS
jgi:hypothetical protein